MSGESRRLLPLIGLAMLGAALYSFAAIPTGIGAAIAWLALVPLLRALERATGRQAFCIGWAFGLVNVLALATVLWPIPGVHAQHLLVPAAFLALYPAVWAVAVVLARRSLQDTLTQDVVAIAAWIVFDYLRANFGFLAFPLGTLAQTQVENLPLIQIAAVFGEAGVSLLVLLGNFALWRAFRRESLRNVALLAAPVMFSVIAGGVVLMQHSGTAVLPTVPMAALHTNYPSFGSAQVPEETRDQEILESLTQAPEQARALFTPETSFINLAAKPQLLLSLQALADAHDFSLVVGVAQAAKFEPAHTATQSTDFSIRAGAWILRPRASEPERYDKVLRVPFSEYLPVSDSVPWPRWLVGAPMEVIQGPGPRVYELPARANDRVKLGAMVCWEGLFAAHARQLTRNRAQVLFQVANEGWFANTSAGVRHNAAVRLRAVENRRWVVVSSNAGPSEIIDAHGRAIARSTAKKGQAWVTANVEPRAALSIYTRLGDVLVYACMLVCALALVTAARSGVTRKFSSPLAPHPMKTRVTGSASMPP